MNPKIAYYVAVVKIICGANQLMSTEEQIDWVEQRAQREKWLSIRGPQLWSDLKSATERAIRSFRKYYADFEITPGKPDYADSVRIHLRERRKDVSRSLEIHYEVEGGLHGIFLDKEMAPVLTIDLDGDIEGHFLKGGEPITVDQASRALLEPFLFKGGQGRKCGQPDTINGHDVS